MRHWLMKSEPSEFSIDDLKRVGSEPWDGVRNYQARNFMRDQMEIGDQAFFYHSSCAEPGVVGIMEVASAAYPDPTAFDPQNHHFDPKSKPETPTWVLVDVKFVRKLKTPVSLKTLRATSAIADMQLLKKGNRLSILPLTPEHWKAILQLSEK